MPARPDAGARRTSGAALVGACAVVAALLAGCATPPQQRAPERAPLTASPDVPPAFPVPSACERMVHLARQEWTLFGEPEVLAGGDGAARLAFGTAAPTHELHAPLLSRVLVYWYSVSRAPIVGTAGELRPWSAAFVSWLARGAGHTVEDFPATVLHWDYIERFMRPRPGDAFETRDPLRHAPQVGDLVCHARDGSADATARANGWVAFASLRRGAYHCDVVVGTRPGEVQTIGGNVSDVVALVRVPTASDGRLLPDAKRPWAAVLARRGAPPLSACAPAPPIAPRAVAPSP